MASKRAAEGTTGGGGKGKSAPRWSQPTPQAGVSLTNVLKQGGSQRLASLRLHAEELRHMSVAMEATPTCEVMRDAALALAIEQTAENDAPLLHVDWGAASGAFARALQGAAAALGRPVRSRSFDILPAGPEVEFADMASPPADSWGLADGSVALMTGIANLTNGRDLPGFFWACARLLRSGGRLVLVQPLNFTADTLALRGVGEVEGLFATRWLRYRDLAVRDKGDGPSRVLELVLERTGRNVLVPEREASRLQRFHAPQRPGPGGGEGGEGGAGGGAGECNGGGGGGGGDGSDGGGGGGGDSGGSDGGGDSGGSDGGGGGGGESSDAMVLLAAETVRRLGRGFQHKLLGTALPLAELAAEVAPALGAAQAAATAAALRAALLASGLRATPLEAADAPDASEAPPRPAASAAAGDSARHAVVALLLSVPTRGAARQLVERLRDGGSADGGGVDGGGADGREPAATPAERRARALLRQLRAAEAASAADAPLGGSAPGGEGAVPVTLCAHFDCRSAAAAVGRASFPAALARVVAACEGGGAGGAERIPHRVEVVELWVAPDGDAAGGAQARAGAGVDPELCARHMAQALLLLLQATAGSYLDGGLGLHEVLDARQGRKGRHASVDSELKEG